MSYFGRIAIGKQKGQTKRANKKGTLANRKETLYFSKKKGTLYFNWFLV